MGDQRPWYDAAFEEGYLDVYPHRDLAAARSEVAGLVERGVGGRVLDLGCGAGRHLLALREHGLDALGLDRSLSLLRRAQPELAGRLVRADFRALPLCAESFGAVLMLFSSFGYFDDEANARVLGEIARVLAPDGTCVLDLMNPARVRATLVPESHARRGALAIVERRRLTHGGTRVEKDVTLRTQRSVSWWHEDVRLYEPGELAGLLPSSGLALLRIEGDFDGRPYEPDSVRQIVWAGKVHPPGGREA